MLQNFVPRAGQARISTGTLPHFLEGVEASPGPTRSLDQCVVDVIQKEENPKKKKGKEKRNGAVNVFFYPLFSVLIFVSHGFQCLSISV